MNGAGRSDLFGECGHPQLQRQPKQLEHVPGPQRPEETDTQVRNPLAGCPPLRLTDRPFHGGRVRHQHRGRWL